MLLVWLSGYAVVVEEDTSLPFFSSCVTTITLELDELEPPREPETLRLQRREKNMGIRNQGYASVTLISLF